MTGQEIFTIVRKHLLSQGAPSLNRAGDCVYRGRDGRKCAIGCLISDEDYLPSMEGKLVGALIANEACLHHIAQESDLLNLLQSLHDELTVECWPTELKRIARKLGFEEFHVVKHYTVAWGYEHENVADYYLWSDVLGFVKLLLTQGTQCKVFSSDFDYDHDGLTEEQLDQLEEIRS